MKLLIGDSGISLVHKVPTYVEEKEIHSWNLNLENGEPHAPKPCQINTKLKN